MRMGTIKTFNDAKGFGVITPDEGGKDLTFLIANLPRMVLDRRCVGKKALYDTEFDTHRQLVVRKLEIL